MNEQFWLVWGLNSGWPTVRHTSYASAEKEASRLAQMHPGREFHVVRAEAVAAYRPVTVTRLADPRVAQYMDQCCGEDKKPQDKAEHGGAIAGYGMKSMKFRA